MVAVARIANAQNSENPRALPADKTTFPPPLHARARAAKPKNQITPFMYRYLRGRVMSRNSRKAETKNRSQSLIWLFVDSTLGVGVGS